MTYKTAVVNSDEYTDGKDEIWNVYTPEEAPEDHLMIGPVQLNKGSRRIEIDTTTLPTNCIVPAVYMHEPDKDKRFLGRIKKISYPEAEVHPFIIKFGSQRNAVYYGVFK